MKPLKRIMCGFVADRTSTNFINIKRFSYPMFFGNERPSLLFGESLPTPNSFLLPSNMSTFEVSDIILQRFSPYREETYRLSEVDHFLAYLEALLHNKYGADRNPLWTWGLCVTLVAAGRVGEATEALSNLGPVDGFDQDQRAGEGDDRAEAFGRLLAT